MIVSRSCIIITLLSFAAHVVGAANHNAAAQHKRASQRRRLGLETRGATPVLPSGWSYKGCYQDQSSPRVLSTQVSNSGSNSVETCVASCVNAGMKYAGMQYGSECWCGNSMSTQNSLSESSCSMSCSGDSTQKCGGNWALSIYTSDTSTGGGGSTTWTSLGCYVDSSTRILPDKSTTSSSMTIPTCQSYCSSAGFTYAGVEAGNECYCSSKTPSSSLTASSSDCSSTCAGDSSTKCGGNWRINIYQSSSGTSTTTTATTTTSTATSTSSSSSTYLGCFQDSASPRLLSWSTQSDSNTPTWCQSTCTSQGYTYYGLQYGKECWCGSSIDMSKKQSTESGCSMSCAGNSSLQCGGSYFMNVYTTSSTTTATSTATSTSATASATPTWAYLGCYSDQSSPRTLPNQASVSSNTNPICQAKCASSGYAYAGTNYGVECWCGSTINAVANMIPSSSCSFSCPGDSSTKCGGSWALSVYYNSALDPASHC